MTGTHVTEELTGEAVGAFQAQRSVEALQRDEIEPAGVWLALIEIAARWGWRSPAVKAFVVELSKRAR